MPMTHFFFYNLEIVRKCAHLFAQLISRLFQLSIDISLRKYCQQISFLSRSIFFPFAQLTGPGQVTVRSPLKQGADVHLFSKLICFCLPCSCLLPLRSLTNYGHHQRGTAELPSFPNSSMCGSWWDICHDRLISALWFYISSYVCHAFFPRLGFTDNISCMQCGTDNTTWKRKTSTVHFS
jgi:hypothetical protein